MWYDTGFDSRYDVTSASMFKRVDARREMRHGSHAASLTRTLPMIITDPRPYVSRPTHTMHPSPSFVLRRRTEYAQNILDERDNASKLAAPLQNSLASK
jgi:hypothetical protein